MRDIIRQCDAHILGRYIARLCERYGPEWPRHLRDALRARCKVHALHRCTHCETSTRGDGPAYHVRGWR